MMSKTKTRAERRRGEQAQGAENGTVLVNMLERVVLMQVLPKEGSIVTLKVLRDLQGHLGFTDEEIREYRLMGDNGQIVLAPDVIGVAKDVPMGEVALKLIKDSFQSLAEQAEKNPEKVKIPISWLPVYERFVEGEA
jgi:hypothetical protein